MLPRPSLGSNPGTTSPPGRSPELQTAGRCALQARHGAPEPPVPPESMARKPRQETAAAKVADHARRLAATVEPWPGPGPQGDLGRLRREAAAGARSGRGRRAPLTQLGGVCLSLRLRFVRLGWRLPRAARAQFLPDPSQTDGQVHMEPKIIKIHSPRRPPACIPGVALD